MLQASLWWTLSWLTAYPVVGTGKSRVCRFTSDVWKVCIKGLYHVVRPCHWILRQRSTLDSEVLYQHVSKLERTIGFPGAFHARLELFYCPATGTGDASVASPCQQYIPPLLLGCYNLVTRHPEQLPSTDVRTFNDVDQVEGK